MLSGNFDNISTLVYSTHTALQSLVSRGKQTTLALHKLTTELSATSVGLSNVTNKFMALQNSQFVENRVQDDDEASEESKKNALIIEEPEKEVILQHVFRLLCSVNV